MTIQSASATLICSVVFADLVAYSTRSVSEQISAKQGFNALLSAALSAIPAKERIMLDTGDGAAVCFMGFEVPCLLPTFVAPTNPKKY